MTADLTWEYVSGALQRREYASYAEYVDHQRAKLDRMGQKALEAHELRYLEALLPRLAWHTLARGTTVLCLGARGGAEVEAFLSLGCFAIGLDLNPGPANPYVLSGDFHVLPYQKGTVGVVFTNALDHAYDIEQVLGEAWRVLAHGGRLLVEAVCGTVEGCAPAEYESLTWPTVEALVQVIESTGCRCVGRMPFLCPWPGQHLVFLREDA